MKQKTILVSIVGASASGKSLLAETLVEELQSEHLCVISEDSYYKDQTEMRMKERVRINYDHPESMDYDLLLKHMHALKNGEWKSQPMITLSTIAHQRHDILTLPVLLSLKASFYSPILNYAMPLTYASLWIHHQTSA